VQLKKRGKVQGKLAALSASLIAATMAAQVEKAEAQSYDAQYYQSIFNGKNDDFGPGVAYSQIDAALLVYSEKGGRITAVEPTLDLTVHGSKGELLSFELIADAVSGATPNGAVKADVLQTFVTPTKTQGTTATVTSASGGATIIHLPGQAAIRQYTVAAGLLPVDKGFEDHRGGFNLGYSQPVGWFTQLGAGGGYSMETDYSAATANIHASKNFNSNNTTISLSLNTEYDTSTPFGGVPTPLAVMDGTWKSGKSKTKTQLGLVAGLTQVVTRNWLMQLNYAYDNQDGYQNDPYRIISVVDQTSGEPLKYLYENRPNKRTTHSVFWDNKIDIGPTLTDISLRYFKDSWGISSKTAEFSERVDLSSSFYIEPSVRWYQQSAANFFHYYLTNGTTLPNYASSDIRLGKFTSITYGAKVGYALSGRTEIYLRGGYYSQTGNGHPADAVGQLRGQDLFSGTKAMFAFAGYTWNFH
jgi:opacity protein-like surface antigen